MNRSQGWWIILAAIALLNPGATVARGEPVLDELYGTLLPQGLLAEASFPLPQQRPLLDAHPEFSDPWFTNRFRLMADTGVSVTFVDEGAGHCSVAGYFAHGDAGTVLDAVNIFDNASPVGSGSALIPGKTIGLGTFPAGTSLGFHSTADGYRSGRAVPDDLIDGTATLPMSALDSSRTGHADPCVDGDPLP